MPLDSQTLSTQTLSTQTLSTQTLSTYALLSLGKHPTSGRHRRSNEDAQAFEMAAKLGNCLGLHAGQGSNTEHLRPFLGMGIAPVSLLDIESASDPVQAFSSYFKQNKFDVILTGSRAEDGESSGMLPYLLAQALDIPVVSQVCDANIEMPLTTNILLTITQALPRGARRSLTIQTPCILILDSSAPPARQSAFGPANRGTIEEIQGYSQHDDIAAAFHFEPAQKKPKRMKKIKATTAAERFKAATASQAKGGQIITPKTSEEGAQAILNLLKEEGLVQV